MHSRLAIDYGACTVRAVLCADGRVTVLPLDGGGEMSTAVHVGGTAPVIGAAAWQRAAVDPDRFVVSPLRAGTGRVTVAGTDVEVAELVAATLRQVAAQAQQTAGEPVDDVRLVVPAGWGPRRRTWLRHAARAAGLAVSRLVEAPIAALAAPGGAISAVAGRPVLVVDVGAGCEATVVATGPAGPDVLATLADPELGGGSLDDAVAYALTGSSLDALPAARRWPMLATVRAARRALGEQAAVTVPLTDGQPPMVVNAALVAEAATPVFERVAGLAAEVLDNADLTLEQLGGVYLIGAAALSPGAADIIAAKLGTAVQCADDPHLAAVLGAADTGVQDPAGAVAPVRLPPVRRTITLTLPGLASLALFAHFVLSAQFINYTPQWPRPGGYVLGNWGELAVAALLAAITLLQAAALFAALLDCPTPPGTAAGGRISGGIALAAAAGLATAGLYALTAAVYFHQPVGGLLRWAVLPLLPTTAAAASVAVLTWRRASAPARGWDSLLTFPAAAMTTATVGIFAVSLWWQGRLPWWLTGWTTTIGLAGGALIGVAIACTLLRHPLARAALAVPFGLFTTITSRSGPDILAVLWAIAVACWWAWHAWTLIRTPPTVTPGR